MSTTTPATIAELPFAMLGRGDAVAARVQDEPDAWRDITFGELATSAIEVAAGLVGLGLDAGDRVAVLGATRPAWSVAHLGIVAAGGVHVSVYPTNSPSECAWVVGDSGARGIVCDDADQAAKIAEVRDELPKLEWVVVLDGTAPGAVALDDVRADGRARGDAVVRERAAAVRPDDPFVFMYTSGTTGPPKGCVLSHGNYRAMVDMSVDLEPMEEGELVYLFLPLAHSFALLFQLIAFHAGGTLAYWGGDMARIVPELAQVKPRVLPSVPRLFEKIYALAVGAREPEEQEKMLAAARLGRRVRDLERAGEPVPDELAEPYAKADRELFANVRALFGGNVQRAVTGAAPIAHEILEFFYGCGVPVMEGYGMTETSTAVAINLPADHRFGTVGRPIPGVEVRVADDGELLVRGPNVFQGYHGNADATFGAVRDGWLHTGDLASIDDDGYVSIVGRKKDIIITAGGKNLTPANIENDAKQLSLVSQAVMHGDRRPYPILLVTLDAEQAAPWASARGLPTDVASLAAAPEVREALQADLDRINARYAPVEQVKRFAVLDRDLTQETGELTPTMKVKRAVVEDHFRDVIEGVYAGA